VAIIVAGQEVMVNPCPDENYPAIPAIDARARKLETEATAACCELSEEAYRMRSSHSRDHA